MENLSTLPNIGPVVSEQLHAVGIQTYEDLAEVGTEAAWLRIQAIDSSACIHRLYALEGAICGLRKTLLPPERKAELKAFYNAHRL